MPQPSVLRIGQGALRLKTETVTAVSAPVRRRAVSSLVSWVCAVLTVLVAVAAAAFYGGIRAEEWHFRDRLAHYLGHTKLSVRTSVLGDDSQRLIWQTVNSNLHTLEYVEVRIGPSMEGGGAIGDVDGHLILISPLGRLSYLNKHHRLGSIDTVAPMGVDELRNSKYNADPLFAWQDFRAYDVLALKKADGSYDMYASFSRYQGEQCFQFAVYKTPIAVTDDAVRAITGKWEEAFTARPGCLRPKDRGWRFLGLGAGGRLVRLDDNTLLVSVGDHQYDGWDDSWAAAQDPSTDLGKIVAIDLPSGKPRVFATGVRNPQGLVVLRDGRILESEHGPQGGDEINLIRAGANYGWPLATYGVNYGYPRRDWPFSKSQGDHEGDFEKPVFVFSPAIGPSNIVEADPVEWPRWKSDVIMGSLHSSTLFHLRLEGDRVRYVEPLFSRTSLRFRDVAPLNGGFATLTNDGTVMIFRNAELHATEPRTVTVTGYGSLSKAYKEEFTPPTRTPAERGKEQFAVNCAQCHSPGGDIESAPPLGGVVGRPVGAVKGVGYSPALANYKGVWTDDLLISYLTDPRKHFDGTVMPAPTMDWLDYPNVVAYLGTLKTKVDIDRK
jgi:cytochrome c2